MSKNVFLILGNGFTIDLLNHLKKGADIDVVNLFSQGAFVPWPVTEQPGFLSAKHCPNLWNLGARTNISSTDGISLLEDIITCASVYVQRNVDKKDPERKRNKDIYILAYQELVKYLKHLFVFYNKKIQIDTGNIADWSWSDFFIKLHKNQDISKVYIVTYNYDIFLERVLESLNITFCMKGFSGDDDHKFIVMKPHGSINFCHKEVLPLENFETSKDGELFENMRIATLDKYEVSNVNLSNNFAIDALIPPTGEASRLNPPWVNDIHSHIVSNAAKLSQDDTAIMSGISYWHVDRREIDEILINLNTKMNIRMINPAPPRALNAVLTSVFQNYVCYPSSSILKEVKL